MGRRGRLAGVGYGVSGIGSTGRCSAAAGDFGCLIIAHVASAYGFRGWRLRRRARWPLTNCPVAQATELRAMPAAICQRWPVVSKAAPVPG